MSNLSTNNNKESSLFSQKNNGLNKHTSHIKIKQSFSNVPTQPIILKTSLLYLWSIGISMGSLIMGYLFVIITVLNSSITYFMIQQFSIDINNNGLNIIPQKYLTKQSIKQNMSLYISICTTSLPLGALIGSLLYHKIIQTIKSQNKLLIYCDIFMIILIISQLINLNIFQLIFLRFLQGIIIGISGIIVPTYLMSISPTKISGKICSLNQIMITIGIALAYSMGYKINQQQLNNPINWRIIIFLPVLMCIVRIIICKIFPFDTLERHIENKDWILLNDFIHNFYDQTSFTIEDLIKSKTFNVKQLAKNFKDNRTTTLLMMQDKQNKQQNQHQKYQNKQSQQIQHQQSQISSTNTLKKSNIPQKIDYQYQHSKNITNTSNTNSASHIIITLSIALCIMNQFSGINAILFYSNQLFLNISHGDTSYAVKKSLQLGIFQIFITLISGNFMDNFGRRTLLIFGDILIILSLFSCYYMLDFDSSSQWDPLYVTYAIFLHIGGFSLSLGPITVVYISQIIQDISPYMTLIWIQTIFVSLTSNIIIQKFGIGKSFLIYAGISALCLIYVYKYMIETKGKTRKNIRQIFQNIGNKYNRQNRQKGIMGISLDLGISDLGNKNYLKITNNDNQLIQSNQ